MQQAREEFLPINLPLTLVLDDRSRYPACLAHLGLEEALLEIGADTAAALTVGALLNLSLRSPAAANGKSLDIPAQIRDLSSGPQEARLRVAFNLPEQGDIRLLNKWALARQRAEANSSGPTFDPRRGGQIFDQLRRRMLEYLQPRLSESARVRHGWVGARHPGT